MGCIHNCEICTEFDCKEDFDYDMSPEATKRWLELDEEEISCL